MSTTHNTFNEKDARLDQLLKALGDTSRRRMIFALSYGPLGIADLAYRLEDPKRVTYHLGVLRRAGLVRSVHEHGRSVLYEFNPASLPKVARLLQTLSAAFETPPSDFPSERALD